MIRHYRRQVDYAHVEDVLHAMFSGENHVVLVEVFDHPEAVTRDGETRGPWVLGDAKEVYAWLESHGHEDYAEQYELGEEDED